LLLKLRDALDGLGFPEVETPLLEPFAPATDAGLWCIALGLVLTAIGSAWYHRDPNNATLVWDRLPDAVFAGVLGPRWHSASGAMSDEWYWPLVPGLLMSFLN
jgi:hypothetical protein